MESKHRGKKCESPVAERSRSKGQNCKSPVVERSRSTKTICTGQGLNPESNDCRRYQSTIKKITYEDENCNVG